MAILSDLSDRSLFPLHFNGRCPYLFPALHRQGFGPAITCIEGKNIAIIKDHPIRHHDFLSRYLQISGAALYIVYYIMAEETSSRSPTRQESIRYLAYSFSMRPGDDFFQHGK